MDRNIRRLGGLFSVLLAALLENLAWLQAFDNRRLTADPHNLRRLEEEYGVKRGSIYSSDGALLAESLERFPAESQPLVIDALSARGDRKTLFGQSNGRGQDVTHRKRAMPLDEVAPASACSRHGNSVRVEGRQPGI